MAEQSLSKTNSLLVVAVAYLVALGAAVASYPFLPELRLWGLSPELWGALLADLVATFAIFAVSVLTRNSSVYDPYWSVAPIALAVAFAVWGLQGEGGSGISLFRVVLCLLLVNLWGHRLTYSWARGWAGLHHEDWRYRRLADKTGAAYWLVSLLGIHLFPTVLTFLSSLPLYVALTAAGRSFGVLDVLGGGICIAAVWMEATADRQLHQFRISDPPKGALLERGVWRYSRHPNYFGEISFWWGLWTIGFSADPGSWWTVIGPLSITLLFVFISIPMIDKRMLASRPAYPDRMRRVSALIPLPPRD